MVTVRASCTHQLVSLYELGAQVGVLQAGQPGRQAGLQQER